MVKKSKRKHNHLKSLYQRPSEKGKQKESSKESTFNSELAFIKKDVFKTVAVTSVLLLVIIILYLYRDAGFLVDFQNTLAGWGGF